MEKVDMVLEKIPLIVECKTICDFILEHYGLQKQFQGYLDKKAEERNTSELKNVMEFYGILEPTVGKFEDTVFTSLDHIDVVCNYLAYKNIDFDRSNFRFQKQTKDDRRYEYKQPKQPGDTSWRP